MSKLPAFQFYPADWLKDPGVQALDYFEQGVWFAMLCRMHESEERGRLVLAGKPMPNEAIARLLGLDKQNFNQILTKLLEYGVASRDEDGVLINRRMVRDENLRKIRSNCGKLGGNPDLVKQKSTKAPSKTQPKRETGVNQISTPSSSSSSSSSTSVKEKEPSIEGSQKKGTRIPPDFALTPELVEWAKRVCPGISFSTETEKFRNYYTAKAGRDATRLDWPATWRNWMLNARDRYGGAAGQVRSADVGKYDPAAAAAYEPDPPCAVCGSETCLRDHRFDKPAAADKPAANGASL